MIPRDRFFIFMVIASILSCENRKELLSTEVYDGPIQEIDSIETFITDSLQLAAVLKAPKLKIFESGNEEYPDGLTLHYYDDDEIVCIFRADVVTYDGETRLYKGVGNVVVENIADGDVMKTEELFWDPEDGTFYTEKFVTIESEGEIHTGEGLTADQDFTSYEILKPSGTITVEENI